MDSGCTLNVGTTGFIKAHSLDVGPLSDLVNGTMGINGCLRSILSALGLHHHKGQAEGVWGYNKDQVALVIPDSTIFGSQELVTLGTPTINWIINVIKKSEINEWLAP